MYLWYQSRLSVAFECVKYYLALCGINFDKSRDTQWGMKIIGKSRLVDDSHPISKRRRRNSPYNIRENVSPDLSSLGGHQTYLERNLHFRFMRIVIVTCIAPCSIFVLWQCWLPSLYQMVWWVTKYGIISNRRFSDSYTTFICRLMKS